MNEITNTAVPLVAGLILGAIFFGGLWWTIRGGLTSDHPASWFLVSHFARMAVTLAGFYFVADGQWQRVLVCLAGFLIARVIVTRLTRIEESSGPRLGKESDHASESG
ncbi:N-ATPase, AtpR subunit [Rubripirellula lacrimiformis]|uniref:N-ATPase, AtpR subunit n=1 Tax=Rubripirellula lacrimiformis TaxID=1930273 RepID=A0A517NIK2_9BACT|nr:ATP synthase subunit I [Rubripirellula lacrimiformis]QDT06965.1 N-ATPase, AtpR subunit [Rubripirellula lacrimiformis]